MDRLVTRVAALGPIPPLGLLLLAYAGGSFAWSSGGLYSALFLASLATAFVIGWVASDLRLVWLSYLAVLIVNVVIACVAWVAPFEALDLTYSFFGGSNYFGAALALGVAAAIGYGAWWTLPFLFLGLAICQSRAALLATAVALFFGLLPRFRGLAACGALLAIFGLVLVSGEGRGYSALARLGIWQDMINHMTFFGHGWGSFADAYAAFPVKRNMTGILAPHAYNDFLETVFELGIGAIPLWLIVILAFDGRDAASRLIVLTFLALSLTFFPLHTLVIGQLSAMALGHLSGKRQPQRNAHEIPTRLTALHRRQASPGRDRNWG